VTEDMCQKLDAGEATGVIYCCTGLTLARCQVPTKAALSLLSSAGQGRENITKDLQVKIRAEGSFSNYCHG